MKIELHPHAIKQWKRISKREHIKIAKKIKQLETAPLSGKLLHGELKGFRSFKAWPYRIIQGFLSRLYYSRKQYGCSMG